MISRDFNLSELRQKLSLLDTPCVHHAMNIIKRALHICRSPDEAVVAFNGGKDCTVLLYLAVAEWSTKFPDTPLTVVYIEDSPSEVFQEIDSFIKETIKHLSLNLIHISNLSTQLALAELIERKPAVRFVFMGTRSTDPHGSQLQAFTPTDISWPALIRVNPILTWNYSDIWMFLNALEIPVCSLYLDGYTSIGYKSKTIRNPHLRKFDGSYKTAADLANCSLERAGRL